VGVDVRGFRRKTEDVSGVVGSGVEVVEEGIAICCCCWHDDEEDISVVFPSVLIELAAILGIMPSEVPLRFTPGTIVASVLWPSSE
jgi:hypothetical protein